MNEVRLFEGFFNRLNGLVNGKLFFGDQFRVRWSINSHLPHNFSDLFSPSTDLEVIEVHGVDYWPENTDPSAGPLCYWYVINNCPADAREVKDAFLYFLNLLEVDPPRQDRRVGLHYRGFHSGFRANPEEFAGWCLDWAQRQAVTSLYAIADTHRESIERTLNRGGIDVEWGKARPIARDLDRGDLQEMRLFISDVIALANCDSILTSFAETTIVDPARALGRKVLSFSGSRNWSKCWFQANSP